MNIFISLSKIMDSHVLINCKQEILMKIKAYTWVGLRCSWMMMQMFNILLWRWKNNIYTITKLITATSVYVYEVNCHKSCQLELCITSNCAQLTTKYSCTYLDHIHLKLCSRAIVMLKLFNLPGELQIVPCIPDKKYYYTYLVIGQTFFSTPRTKRKQVWLRETNTYLRINTPLLIQNWL